MRISLTFLGKFWNMGSSWRWSKMKDADATNDTHEVEEPWLPIETKLVVSSVVGGIAILIVLAIFVHMFILR